MRHKLIVLVNAAALALVTATAIPAGAAPTFAAQQNWSDLQNRATHALDTNRYWLAEPLLKQAVEESKSFGDADLRYAKSLGELGRLYTVRGKFAEAEPYLEQEFAVKERALGIADGKLIPSMASLIKFYLLYGTASKAQPLTARMLGFVEGKLMESLPDAGVSTKFKKGQVLEAYAQAADGSLHPTMEWALACDDVANVYKDRGDLAMADRLYKAALDVKADIVGKEHLALASSYDCVGSVCMARGDAREAASYFRDALAATQRLEPGDDPQVFARTDKYAKALLKQGKYAEAERLYLQAQRAANPDPQHDTMRARATFALGCLYCDQKKYAQAAPMLRQALHLAEAYHGPASANIVPYLEKYAYALYHLGRKAEQERLKTRAATIAGVM
jgi:tetratricopeptide (TPR) repeat protein